MLIVAGTIDVDPARRDEFLAGRHEAVRATRSEPGCLEYAFSADLVDPGRIRVFECWESADHLQTHLGLLSRQPAPQGGVDVLGREFHRYEIASVSDL